MRPPIDETELLSRCRDIEGLSFSALASRLNLVIPSNPIKRKGYVGMMIEKALGTTAGHAAKPDFEALGIELKTLPIGAQGQPKESTFVTSIHLLNIQSETFETSQCYAKLKRVLWLPIEGEQSIDFLYRRIGHGFLWSPNEKDETILKQDWQDLSFMLSRGQLADVDARMGEYLQVRPKAANARALCYGFDEHGDKVLTLPRGFYLRPSFTRKIITSLG